MKNNFFIFLKRIFITAFLIMTIWIMGFGYFIITLDDTPPNMTETTEGIVVLTGGKGRVEMGLNLYYLGLGKKLFISGVHKGVDAKALASRQQLPDDLGKLLDDSQLGYEAQNTIQNAMETEEWIKQNHIASIRLVTADYHVKRSLIEFKRLVPGIIVIPHPVKTSNRWRAEVITIFWHEYIKLTGCLLGGGNS